MGKRRDHWRREYVRMQCVLASVMCQQICWYDRVALSDAMTANRTDYENSVKEMDMLCGGSAPEQQEQDGENDNG